MEFHPVIKVSPRRDSNGNSYFAVSSKLGRTRYYEKADEKTAAEAALKHCHKKGAEWVLCGSGRMANGDYIFLAMGAR